MQPQTRNNGAIAQLVEQRTENPCVPGSIPGGTTIEKAVTKKVTAFLVSKRMVCQNDRLRQKPHHYLSFQNCCYR